MKQILWTLLLVFISVGLFSQTDSTKNIDKKLHYGINVSYNATLYVWEALTPSLVLIKERHTFLIGPRVFISRSSPHYKWTRSGLEFTYRIFPNPKCKRFNFYFFYDLDMAMIRSKKNVDYYQNNIHYAGDRTETRYSVTNHVGYGFKLKIVKGFYFNQNVGAGIALYRDDEALNIPDTPSLSYSTKGNIISYGTPTFLMSIGLGYDF